RAKTMAIAPPNRFLAAMSDDHNLAWIKSATNELNNLLQVIAESSQFLEQEHGAAASSRKYFDIIKKGVERATAVTRQMVERAKTMAIAPPNRFLAAMSDDHNLAWIKSATNELNNLLQVIAESSQFLEQEHGAAASSRKYFDIIKKGVERATAVTRQMVERA